MATKPSQKVAVIGSGLIGRSYAMLFASGGHPVVLYDIDHEQVNRALVDIEKQLNLLEKQGLLKGSLPKEEQLKLIKGVTDLKACLEGAFFVQECIPERLELKRDLWARLDSLVPKDAILSSSTSAILPSAISDGMVHKNHFIVSHPVNPPFYVPLVEVVPASWTDGSVTKTTMELLSSIGLVPVLVKKEVPGFVLNRIQYAILAEAWRLIRDDVVSAEDLDKTMSCGLGMRYAFMGPWETGYLNAEGLYSYSERYADTILGTQLEMGPPERIDGPVLDKIQKEMEAIAGPVSDIAKRRQWRDKRLAALARLKATLDKEDKDQPQ